MCDVELEFPGTGPPGPPFCFICGISCHELEPPQFFTGSCSSVAQDLQVYLMLKHVFELPRKSFKNCFQQGSEPRSWIRFCSNCTDCYVSECVKLHQQFIAVKKKFDSVKKKAVQLTKQTLNKPRTSVHLGQALEVGDFVKNHNYAVDKPNEVNLSKILAGDELATEMLTTGAHRGGYKTPSADIYFDENDESSSPSSEASIECLEDDTNDVCAVSSDDDIEILEESTHPEDIPPSNVPPTKASPNVQTPAILPDEEDRCPSVIIKGPEIIEKIFQDNRNKCSHCGWRPAENAAWPKEELKSHVLEVHGLSQLKCQKCGKCFDKFKQLKAHKPKCVQGAFECHKCGKKFYRQSFLTSHAKYCYEDSYHSE